MSRAKRRGNLEGSNPIQRKDGRWQVNLRFTDDLGVSRRISVTGKTATEARIKVDEVRERLKEGLPARDKKVTVGAFAEEWISSALAASGRKATTKQAYESVARKHIVAAGIGGVPLDRLKPRHVEAWVVELRGRELSESTIRSTYTVLRSVLDTAVRDEMIARNPAAAIKRPKVTPKEAAYLSPVEVRRLLSAAGSSRYEPLFRLLVNTGLRRGEALALRWSDVDQEKNLIHVRGTLSRVEGGLIVTAPKTAKSKRSVHLSPVVDRVLRAVRQRQREERLRAGSAWVQTPYVFTTETGEPCDPRNALRALKAAARKAELPGIGLHTLRHSAATVMLENGVPLKVVSEVLGHSSVAITGDVYGHVSPDVAATAMDALGAALDG